MSPQTTEQPQPEEPRTEEPRTEQPHAEEPRTRRDVADLFAGGRLKAIPRKAARREQLLVHLSGTLFAPDRDYTEPEVNEALRTVHEDCSALRRYLITSGLLTRTRDGSSYRRATTTR
ncbi:MULTISPECIES: DUF2087 domain-containing protein [unclassified Streptomyces]|uniref:DUF2087 domain-containing protein n=1 Tax=unclassified Streptomyces TaxID=2593676 RepID=UPI001BE91B26|nr:MULTISPECIES: DUF2087 domain-containing protein [unclassified Streptomyces]MBT2408187.1 DUF2087 domain-containing protein [Streptomyces sp. ISL-21]MBT2609255.1 DUF2087 domain-containing protein [Streptomyces sp. ISL-87]